MALVFGEPRLHEAKCKTVEQVRQDPFWRERTINQAGVPIRANPRHAVSGVPIPH